MHGGPNDLANSLACLFLYFTFSEEDNLSFTHLSKLGGGEGTEIKQEEAGF